MIKWVLKVKRLFNRRNKNEYYWNTKDGRRIRVCDLEYSHLVNIIRFIKRKGHDGDSLIPQKTSDGYKEGDIEIAFTVKEIIDIFEEEQQIKRRLRDK